MNEIVNVKKVSWINWLKTVIMLFAFHFSLNPCSPQSWTADNGNGTYTNPLFYDEFSDPDILRVGDDYYLAGTTMHTVPGLVILHSKDLVNWENASTSPMMLSRLRTTKRYTVRVSGHLLFVMPMVCSMYSPTSMARACSAIPPRISGDLGSITTCRDGSTTSPCFSMTTERFMPSMATEK